VCLCTLKTLGGVQAVHPLSSTPRSSYSCPILFHPFVSLGFYYRATSSSSLSLSSFTPVHIPSDTQLFAIFAPPTPSIPLVPSLKVFHHLHFIHQLQDLNKIDDDITPPIIAICHEIVTPSLLSLFSSLLYLHYTI
jgi:hypothetical protein